MSWYTQFGNYLSVLARKSRDEMVVTFTEPGYFGIVPATFCLYLCEILRISVFFQGNRKQEFGKLKSLV